MSAKNVGKNDKKKISMSACVIFSQGNKRKGEGDEEGSDSDGEDLDNLPELDDVVEKEEEISDSDLEDLPLLEEQSVSIQKIKDAVGLDVGNDACVVSVPGCGKSARWIAPTEDDVPDLIEPKTEPSSSKAVYTTTSANEDEMCVSIYPEAPPVFSTKTLKSIVSIVRTPRYDCLPYVGGDMESNDSDSDDDMLDQEDVLEIVQGEQNTVDETGDGPELIYGDTDSVFYPSEPEVLVVHEGDVVEISGGFESDDDMDDMDTFQANFGRRVLNTGASIPVDLCGSESQNQ